MRIAMLVGPSTGGIGTHVTALTDALREEGHPVRLLSDPLTIDTFGWDGATPAWPVPRRPGDIAGSAVALAALRRAVRHGRPHCPDLVHAHGLRAGIIAAAVTGRTPLVVSLHNRPPGGEGSTPRGARPMSRRARLVTGASTDLVRLARAWGAEHAELAPVSSPRLPGLLTAPRTGRAEVAQRLGLPADLPVVLAVARDAPQKRLDVLERVARDLDGTARIVLIGSASPRESLHVRGPRTDLDLLYLGADALVLTSDWEARALVVQEAMAAGLPVVAPAVGGVPDLMTPAAGEHAPGAMVTGSADPRASAAAVGAALRALLANPERAATAGAAGRRIAATWPAPADETVAWLARYRRLMDRPSPRW